MSLPITFDLKCMPGSELGTHDPSSQVSPEPPDTRAISEPQPRGYGGSSASSHEIFARVGLQFQPCGFDCLALKYGTKLPHLPIVDASEIFSIYYYKFASELANLRWLIEWPVCKTADLLYHVSSDILESENDYHCYCITRGLESVVYSRLGHLVMPLTDEEILSLKYEPKPRFLSVFFAQLAIKISNLLWYTLEVKSPSAGLRLDRTDDGSFSELN